MAPFGQPIDAACAAAHVLLLARHQARPLEPMERGIDGAFGKIEHLVTAQPQLLDDAVAMQGPLLDDRQKERIEMAFELLGCHT